MMRKTQASAVKNLLPAIARQAQSSVMAQPCQNALDDLITSQTQALETLKTHKKGLMQQLFPSLEEKK